MRRGAAGLGLRGCEPEVRAGTGMGSPSLHGMVCPAKDLKFPGLSQGPPTPLRAASWQAWLLLLKLSVSSHCQLPRDPLGWHPQCCAWAATWHVLLVTCQVPAAEVRHASIDVASGHCPHSASCVLCLASAVAAPLLAALLAPLSSFPS